MTLWQFKKNLKKGLLIIIFLSYGLGAFWLGRFSIEPLSLKIKGTSTSQFPESPVESPVPFADTQSNKIIASSVKLCANTIFGYELSYPNNWFTTYNTEEEKCRFFAPFSFVVPKENDLDFVPVKILVVELDDWLLNQRIYTNPNDFQNILKIETTTINQRPAQKVIAETTEKSSLGKGLLRISYLIFDSKIPLIFSYQQLTNQEDITNLTKILEDMTLSVTYLSI